MGPASGRLGNSGGMCSTISVSSLLEGKINFGSPHSQLPVTPRPISGSGKFMRSLPHLTWCCRDFLATSPSIISASRHSVFVSLTLTRSRGFSGNCTRTNSASSCWPWTTRSSSTVIGPVPCQLPTASTACPWCLGALGWCLWENSRNLTGTLHHRGGEADSKLCDHSRVFAWSGMLP
jgi:hypothetical protein